jgi:hypothetical protein
MAEPTSPARAPAKERWSKLQSRRSAVLERARDCAKLTIPGLLPPQGHSDTASLPTPFQSIGARGVNNLASKLLLALLPPGTAFFRLSIAEATAAELGTKLSAVEEALAVIERRVTHAIEASPVRPLTFEALSHLIVTGNAMMHVPAPTDIRLFRIDQFCILRDAGGNPVESVILETVHPSTLPQNVIAACKIDVQKDERVDVYTSIVWTEGAEEYWQEINDVEVPGTRGSRPKGKNEWMPLRWRAVPGQDYGRGQVEEYLGDLKSLEYLNEAIVQFAAAASKIVLMVRPNASTDTQDYINAESGDAITGNPDDCKFLQVEKYADFQVANSVAERLEQRLSHAFLLRSGVTRDAERVTAEEIRAMAQELEDVLGGVYTVLSQEFQLPFVRRLMASIKDIPALPKGTVEPVIVTGFEALGRNHTLNKLRAFLADVQQSLGPQALAMLNPQEVLSRLGTGYGVEDVAALIKSPEQVAQEKQEAMGAQIVDKATGPVAGAMAKQMAGQ